MSRQKRFTKPREAVDFEIIQSTWLKNESPLSISTPRSRCRSVTANERSPKVYEDLDQDLDLCNIRIAHLFKFESRPNDSYEWHTKFASGIQMRRMPANATNALQKTTNGIASYKFQASVYMMLSAIHCFPFFMHFVRPLFVLLRWCFVLPRFIALQAIDERPKNAKHWFAIGFRYR